MHSYLIEKHALAAGTRFIEYGSNNSGGSWWLDDKDWLALEVAGWIVDWKKDEPDAPIRLGPDGRWLGALATSAFRVALDMADAIAEWERVTGKDSSDLGCACCGSPHSFSEQEVYEMSADELARERDFDARMAQRSGREPRKPRASKLSTRYCGARYAPEAPEKGERFRG